MAQEQTDASRQVQLEEDPTFTADQLAWIDRMIAARHSAQAAAGSATAGTSSQLPPGNPSDGGSQVPATSSGSGKLVLRRNEPGGELPPGLAS